MLEDALLEQGRYGRLSLVESYAIVNYVRYKRRRTAGNPDGRGDGVVPEPHVTHGIDDLHMHKHFEDHGLQIDLVRTILNGSYLPVTIAYRLARRARGFSFAVQKKLELEDTCYYFGYRGLRQHRFLYRGPVGRVGPLCSSRRQFL